jgi:integrase
MKGSITQRGKNSWRLQIRRGKGPDGRYRRYTETIQCTKPQAQARLRELLVSLDKGGFIPQPGRMTVGDLLKVWLDGYARTNTGDRTYLGYESIIRCHLTPNLGGIRLKDLSAPVVQQYYGALVHELSRRSVHSHHVVLNAALKYACRQGLLVSNPCSLVDPPSFQKKLMRTLTPVEVGALLESGSDSFYFACIYAAVSTGLRQAELLGLRWRDLDLDMLSISVSQVLYKRAGITEFKVPKTRHSRRRVRMTPKLALFLRDYRADRESMYLTMGRILSPDNLVFTSIAFEPLNSSVLSHNFMRIAAKAGIKNASFHTLRHTYASLMLMAGVSPKVISESLGHSSVAFTMDTYSHVLQGMHEDAAAKLDAILPAANGKRSNAGAI